ncbi:MAG: M20/M25/M40 family metallo-hydrolase [Phycisphaerales bacterium]
MNPNQPSLCNPTLVRLCTGICLGTLIGIGGCTTTNGQRPDRDTQTSHEANEHSGWDKFSRDMPREGRMVFSPQPTPEELHAFAEAGGRVVVNMRTDAEMAEVGFDEEQVVRDLGMHYVRIPTDAGTFGEPLAEQFQQMLESTQGPVLAHCATGSRAAMVYGLYLIEGEGLDREAGVERAQSLGMRPQGARLIERTQMEIPDRVMQSVDPERIRESIDRLASFGTRHTLSETESDTRGIGAARRWVKARFEKNTEGHGKSGDVAPQVYFDAHTVEPDGRRITEEVEVVNVVCEIPGSNPASRDRLYYVLAHLDSRASGALDATSDAPGANDDGSGVAALLELARVLAGEPIESTIVLMATSGEEQGLFGARLHAQAAKDAGGDIRAVLNNDTIGDPTGVLPDQDGRNEIRVFSEGLPASMLDLDDEEVRSAARRLRLYGTESDSDSRQLARYIAEVADLHKTAVQPRLVFRPDRFLRGGDHTPFNELGYAAIRFCELYENYDHQLQDVRIEDGVQFGDLPEYVDEDYLADVTRLNAVVLVHLANAPSSPRDARIIAADLTNDTTLRWEPSLEPDVAGYEIVWRETTSSSWDQVQDVGNATEGTVDLSKDNWFFGVRAYDEDGYRSPVSYPVPARE